MKGNKKHVGYAVIILLSALFVLGAFSRVWEFFQKKQYIQGAIVREIVPYSFKGGDLHWSYKGNRLYIVGESRIIDFPLKNWDNTVREGDSVNLVIRKSFPWFGLANEFDGIEIDDNK